MPSAFPPVPDAGARFVPRAWAYDDRQPTGADRLRRNGSRRGAGRGAVLAAVDGGATTRPVLAVAGQLVELLGNALRVVCVHGDRVARGLRDASRAGDVRVLVLGARERLEDPRPLGTIAGGLAAAADRPVVVVPPGADPTGVIQRVLVPLDGAPATSAAARGLAEAAVRAGREVTAAHVVPPGPALRREPDPARFLARHCPWDGGAVDLVTRAGRADELIPALAWERRTDLVVVGWSRRLAGGHASVVRALLDCPPAPVALVPVRAAP